MKKYVFYPILFSINPILLLLAANISDLPPSQLFPVILISPAVTAVSMWGLNKWLKNIHRTGFIVFLATIWFFHYGTVRLWANPIYIGSTSLGSYWILFPLWTLILILFSSGLLWRRITSPETITLFLNIVCIILVAFSVVRISLDIVPRYLIHPDVSDAAKALSPLPAGTNLPDVYYIILDGYARNDVLQEIYHYDNSAFVNALEDRGFFIASDSQSNYMQTALSVSSSLNMEYLTGFSKVTPDRGQLIGMIRNSKARVIFESFGYKTIGFSSGYQPTEWINSDDYYSSPSIGKSHDLEALLLINSAAEILIEQKWLILPITKYRTQQERILYTFSTLANQVPSIAGPKLIFAHVVAPHPPFVFDRNGPITPDAIFVLQDGNKYWGNKDEYIHKYVGQLTYISKLVIETIDDILDNSTKPPIIIIQADHGPGAYLDWNSSENTCLKERFSILNAYYFPDNKVDLLNENVTPVNTFRIIFNSYFGTDFDLLDNKEYFSTWDQPYNFIDVSDIVQSQCNIK